MAPHSVQVGRVRAALDVVATVLTIGTCAVVSSVVVLQFMDKGQPVVVDSSLVVGTVLEPSEGVLFDRSDVTVLVGLSSTCQYCARSMPALRQLNDVARSSLKGHVRVIAVGFETPDVLGRYLQENQLSEFEVASIDRESRSAPVASRTPTLVVVDRTGTVTASWTGWMTVDQMNSVVSLNNIDGKGVRPS